VLSLCDNDGVQNSDDITLLFVVSTKMRCYFGRSYVWWVFGGNFWWGLTTDCALPILLLALLSLVVVQLRKRGKERRMTCESLRSTSCIMHAISVRSVVIVDCEL